MTLVIKTGDNTTLSDSDRLKATEFFSTSAGRELLGLLSKEVYKTKPSIPTEGSSESNYSFQAGRVRGAYDVFDRLLKLLEN